MGFNEIVPFLGVQAISIEELLDNIRNFRSSSSLGRPKNETEHEKYESHLWYANNNDKPKIGP